MYTNNGKFIILFAYLLLIPKIEWAQIIEIWEIQGDSIVSSRQGELVQTSRNIITAVDVDGFFIQTPSERIDDNELTSNGIKIITGTRPFFEEGVLVDITGTVREINGMTVITNPGLNIVPLNESVELPTPIQLDDTFPGTNAQIVHDLERVEGMLITFDALVTSPSNFANEVSLTTRLTRPFREVGIEFPGIEGLPVWDGNPEIFWFDPDRFGEFNFGFINAEMNIKSEAAILVQTEERYYAYPKSYQVTGEPVERAVRPKEADEITIASLNMLQYKVTEPDYNNRIPKFALYITQLLNSPDIIAVQEVGGERELMDLSRFLSITYQKDYRVLFNNGNDGIHVAYLVGALIQEATIEQYLAEVPLGSGSLHDRPPLILRATIPSEPPTELLVMNLHLRSRRDIEDSDRTNFVRTKRFQQSKGIAELVQTFQNDNLVIVGDFNAFEFTDGYVDVVNQIAGIESMGALFPSEDIVSPPLANLTAALPEGERFSFVFEGNAELLDHCLTNELSDFTIADLEFARGNADNTSNYMSNINTPIRSTDHDAFVLYLKPEGLFTATHQYAATDQEWITLSYPSPGKSGDWVLIQNTSKDNIHLRLFNHSGQLLDHQELGNQSTTNYQLPGSLAAGEYWIQIQSVSGKEKTSALLIN